MNLLLLFLAFLLVLAVAAGFILLKHLHRKEAQLKSVLEQSRPEDAPSIPNEMSAIDQLLYDRCCRYMTEHKPFLVESFSRQDLAVNYYRVMYAMELYRNNMSLRVTDLSQLSGFHSTTSFFQSFKNVMGEPPSHWCSRVRRKYLKDNEKN